MKLKPEERKAIAHALRAEVKSKYDRLRDDKVKELENSEALKNEAQLQFEAVMKLSPIVKDEYIGENITPKKIMALLINNEMDKWENSNEPKLFSDAEILSQILFLEASVASADQLKGKIKLQHETHNG